MVGHKIEQVATRDLSIFQLEMDQLLFVRAKIQMLNWSKLMTMLSMSF